MPENFLWAIIQGRRYYDFIMKNNIYSKCVCIAFTIKIVVRPSLLFIHQDSAQSQSDVAIQNEVYNSKFRRSLVTYENWQRKFGTPF